MKLYKEYINYNYSDSKIEMKIKLLGVIIENKLLIYFNFSFSNVKSI
jgi:hypothetical protein